MEVDLEMEARAITTVLQEMGAQEVEAREAREAEPRQLLQMKGVKPDRMGVARQVRKTLCEPTFQGDCASAEQCGCPEHANSSYINGSVSQLSTNPHEEAVTHANIHGIIVSAAVPATMTLIESTLPAIRASASLN